MAKATKRKAKTGHPKRTEAAPARPGDPDYASVATLPAPGPWNAETLREAVVLEANHAAVEKSLKQCGTVDLETLRKLHLEAKGDWRRAMIARRIKEIAAGPMASARLGGIGAAGGPRRPILIVQTEANPVATIVAPPTTVGDCTEVLLAHVEDEPLANHRLDTGDLASLTQSLERDNLLQPVVLRQLAHPKGKTAYAVVDGRRRIAAARNLGWTGIRAWVYSSALDEATVRRLEAVANLERRDLNPVEEALAVVRLLEARTGRTADVWTDVDAGTVRWAAAALGRSEAWIRSRAYLTRLCEKVRNMVADGRLPLAQAREICKLASAEEQTNVAASAVGWGDPHIPDANRITHVNSVAQVRRAVEERLSTLRGVPWETGPGAPGFAGRPACAGCPDNSANSLLFGADAKDAAPEARCLNAVCYRAKMKAAEAALERTVKDLKSVKAVAATVAGVRDHIPEYMKAATVARKLDQARGTAPKPKSQGKGGPKEVPYQDRPETKLAEAVHKWKEGIDQQIVNVCLSDPMRMARLALVRETKTWHRNVQWGDQASKAVRTKCDPILAKVAAKDAAKALGELVADIDPEKTETGLPLWAVRHLAGLLDVNLPPEPKIEDFLPKEAASDEPQAASKKKTKAKKATDDAGDECDRDCETCTAKDCVHRDGDGMPD